MSKLVKAYKAKFFAAEVTADYGMDGYVNDIGKIGKLSIWESEKLHPGENYISFRTDDESVDIQTSCGNISIFNNNLSISTQDGANNYTFKLIKPVQTVDFRIKLPERYWHICNGCQKKEILSSKEAFEQGWDFPGPDGIYKHSKNYGFREIAPRTCGDCLIMSDKLYWDLVTRPEDASAILEREKSTVERILDEPWSLLVSEDENQND